MDLAVEVISKLHPNSVEIPLNVGLRHTTEVPHLLFVFVQVKQLALHGILKELLKPVCIVFHIEIVVGRVKQPNAEKSILLSILNK